MGIIRFLFKDVVYILFFWAVVLYKLVKAYK